MRADKRVRAVTASRALGTPTPPPTAPIPSTPATATPDQSAGADTPAAGRAWQAGKPGKPGPDTGAGMVIGVLDTGIWPESASFAATMPARRAGTAPARPAGASPPACNGKIVGARYFADAWLAYGGRCPRARSSPPATCRARHAHRLHRCRSSLSSTSRSSGATSARLRSGARRADRRLQGAVGRLGQRRRHHRGIDAAVADGVQVINYSIGTALGDCQPNSPIGIAFLNAYLAGVFVAASAGNDGMSGMISNAEPWVTTVGAAVERSHEATVDSATAPASSAPPWTAASGRSTPIVFADQAGSLDDGAQYCWSGSLDPAKVKGKIVACDFTTRRRGGEVKAKGGVGVVLFDPIGNVRLNVDLRLPGRLPVERRTGRQALQLPVGAPYRRHRVAARAAVTAPASRACRAWPDSRPTARTRCTTGAAKPDLVAPGIDIIAAVSPAGFGRHFDAYSGTSMAAPHVAGMAAILRAKHPNWSPGAIASALRTTAADTRAPAARCGRDGSASTWPGPTDPGLVIDRRRRNWSPSRRRSPDGKELNLPSISLREYDGTSPVTAHPDADQRRPANETYRASVSGLPGMEVNVSAGIGDAGARQRPPR